MRNLSSISRAVLNGWASIPCGLLLGTCTVGASTPAYTNAPPPMGEVVASSVDNGLYTLVGFGCAFPDGTPVFKGRDTPLFSYEEDQFPGKCREILPINRSRPLYDSGEYTFEGLFEVIEM